MKRRIKMKEGNTEKMNEKERRMKGSQENQGNQEEKATRKLSKSGER